MPAWKAADYCSALRPRFAGRRFLVTAAGLPGALALARDLVALGAEPPFLLPAGSPDEDEELPEALGRGRRLRVRGADLLDSFRQYESALVDAPASLRRDVDAWDPEGRARAIGYIVMNDPPSAAGRSWYARRLPAWAGFEDKTRLHGFLDQIGVRRGPVAVVPAERVALAGAHARLDRGFGTVWAADATQGLHGGATLVRRVRSGAQAAEVADFFGGRCLRVRVSPFVEGVPCSVHGIVFPEGVSVFRPVELLTLSVPGRSHFVYAGTSTCWDPCASARDELRALGRAVGQGLAQEAGYRGAYTVDGVLGEGGFVPTEINARIGAGFFHLTEACGDLPLGPLALAARAGERLGLCPGDLEASVLEAADARRSGSGRLNLPSGAARAGVRPLVRDAAGFRPAKPDEDAAAELRLSPSPAGSFLQFTPKEAAPRRDPFAADVVAAFAYAEGCFGLEIGPLVAAEPVS